MRRRARDKGGFRRQVLIALVLMGSTIGQKQILQAEEVSIIPTVTGETMLADQFALLTIRVLGENTEQGEVTDDQLIRAQTLLDLALELSPNDADLWQLKLRMANRRGDAEGKLLALQNYCRLRPMDDGALFDWIILDVEQELGVIDDRIKKLEGILRGPGSKKMSLALRSRLASYLAVIGSDTNNDGAFRDWLIHALRMDPTNRTAAMMAYEYLVEHNSPPGKVAVAIKELIVANPVDPNSHYLLAEHLFAHGAYEKATDQFQVAQDLSGGSAGDLPFYRNWVVSMVCQGKVSDGLLLLGMVQAAMSAPADSPDNSANLNQLPIELQALRAMIQLRGGLTSASEASFRKLSLRLKQALRDGDTSAQLPLATLLIWFGRETEKAETLLEQMDSESTSYQLLRGWLSVHMGNGDEARQLLGPLAKDSVMATYVLATIDHESDESARVAALRRVIAMEPGSIAAMAASLDIHRMGIELLPATEMSLRLTRLVEQWDPDLVLPDPNQKPWLFVGLKIDKTRYEYLEPITAMLRIRNATDHYLAVGREGPVPGQAVLFLRPGLADPRTARWPPIAVSIDKRLRLEPRQEIEVPIRVDRSPLGVVLSGAPITTVPFQIIAMLDPRVTKSGYETGMMGGRDTISMVNVMGLPPTEANVYSWIATVQQAERNDAFRAMARLCQIAPQFVQQEQFQEIGEEIGAVVEQAFTERDSIQQAWIVRFCPSNTYSQSLFKRVHELAQRSDDRMVRVMYLSTQVMEPTSPAIKAAIRHSDERIAAYAKAHRTFVTRYLLRAEELSRQRAEAEAAAKAAR